MAGFLGGRGQEVGDGVVHHHREPVPAQLRNRLGDRGDGVVVVHHRTVPGPGAGRQAHPQHSLFGGLDQVETPFAAVAARHRQREATHLAHGLGDAFEQIGPVLHQPFAAVFAAGFLVGDEGEHQIARRDHAVAFELPGDRDHHPDHVLHVDCPAAPHISVLDCTGERMHAPVGGLGGHHIQVAVNQQRAAGSVGTFEPGEHVGPPRRPRFHLGDLVSHGFELLGHPAGAFGLPPGGLQLTGVGGVEPDQGADEVNHLIDRAHGSAELGHDTFPTTCRSPAICATTGFGPGHCDPLALAAPLSGSDGAAGPSGGMADALA